MPVTSSISDAIETLSRAVDRLGNSDAATSMGGLEAHGQAMRESAQLIAEALESVAAAIQAVAAAIVPLDLPD